jgi:hypothetical protein
MLGALICRSTLPVVASISRTSPNRDARIRSPRSTAGPYCGTPQTGCPVLRSIATTDSWVPWAMTH